ncbi:Ig heavy chain Mem5-like [Hemitrygon akajei]|uniref:Ig heavy chain Mem5-like n=1 Tax=Hemitrygon akajei TaxID=2704970 RepID=UPI003BFA2AC8
MIRCVTSNNPSNWSDHLPWVEYAHNSLVSSAIGRSPFECSLGYQPLLFPALEEEIAVPSDQNHIDQCLKVWEETRTALLRSAKRNKKTADRHRTPVPDAHCGSGQSRPELKPPISTVSKSGSVFRAMGVVPYLCLLLSCLAGVHSDIVLTQPESAVVKPGQSHRLSCAVGTFDSKIYGIHWLKPISGKGLVWLAGIYYDDNKYYAPGVQGRFTVSKDSSTVYLQMNNLRLDDTATYYCARYSNDMKYYLDYWGGGTSLTVTSEVKSIPSVYITSSCNTESDQGIRLLCLVKDYQPESISQTWSTNSGDITTGIKKYLAVLGQNLKYTMSSLLEVSAADWKNKVYYCKAGYKPNEIVTAEWRKRQPESPKLSSLVPSREVIHSQANAVLGCVISGFSPDNI